MAARVVLIGAPGSGKTKTGKRVAKALGIPHLDTDKLIVAEHGPVTEIFATQGEPAFRALERQAVIRALAADAVVSLGGGAVLDQATQADLVGVPVVLLSLTLAGAQERMGDHPEQVAKRPLLAGGGLDAWAALVAVRRPLYDSLADVTIDTSHRTFDSVAEEVLAWLESR